MTDTIIYLQKISDFSRFLRTRGLSAGLQETEDACAVISDMELDDRETVKCALRAIYAKTQAEQEIFDRCFDRYFITSDMKHALEEAERKAAEEYEQKRRAAEQELQYNGSPMELTEEYRDIYIRMSDEAKERLQRIRERFGKDIDRNPDLYAGFIHSVFMRSILEQQMMMEDAAAHAEAFLSPELDLLYRDISQFKDSEIPQAIELIGRISRQINAELQSRHQRPGSSGKLDFKRTIRKGLETGGNFYRLKYKRKHRRRKRVVMLCDVSASMLQFSEFALRFIHSMSEVSEFSRTFIFSESMQEIDRFFMESVDDFRDRVRSSGLYGKGTDLSQALGSLLSMQPQLLGPQTVLIILSDAKTVNVSETEQLLSEALRRTGSVIWLNPIPEGKWRYVQTIGRIAQICRMLPCSTLHDLSMACRRIVRD